VRKWQASFPNESNLLPYSANRIEGEKPIRKDKEETIQDFFEHPWILAREVDRFVAEDAGHLI